MKHSPDIFHLIRSLTMSEKRHFTVYASRHVIGEKNNYIKLFKVLEGMKVYDEEIVYKELKGEKFLPQLAKYKNYLYELILKSLRVYHSCKTIGLELKELLEYAEILFGKGLYRQCARIITKTKKLALAYEKFELLIEILRMEELLLQQNVDDKKAQKQIIRFIEEKENIFEKITNLNAYTDLYFSILVPLRKKGWARTGQEMERLQKVVRNTRMKSEQNALSYEARFLYNLIHCVYAYFGEDDLPRALQFAKKFVDIISEKEELRIEKPGYYIAALDAYFIICVRMKKHREALNTLERLESFPAGSTDTQIRIQDRLFYMQIYLLLNTAEFQKAIALVEPIEQWMKTYREQISKYTLLALSYNIAFIYFGAGHYHKSLVWLNRIINDTEINIREDVQAFCRVFNLVIHFELKNFELLEYIIKSTSRFLTKTNRLFKVEKIILDFMKKVIDINSPRELSDQFRLLKKQLLPLKEDPYERKAFEGFDFLSWVDSKLAGKTFQEVFSQKHNISEEAFLEKIREGV